MQLKKVGLLIAGASMLAALASCGPDEPSSPGTCTSNASCSTDEICHPTAKVCAKTCQSGADCPESAKTCDALTTTGGADGGATTTKICKCSTTPLCGTDNVCSDFDKVCMAKCTSNANCPAGRDCDTATGQCKAPGGGGNCTPACTGGQVCDASGTTPTCVNRCTIGACGSGKTCNTTSGLCETAKACSGTAQPGACSYGQYCGGSSCADVEKPTCNNFDPAQGGKQPVWNPPTSNGPVIYSLTSQTPDNAFCTAPLNAFTTLIKAYRTDADWPASHTGVSGFFYVRVNGSQLDATTSMRPSGYTPSGKEATFKITLCDQAVNSISAGFYFTGGNEACTTITR